MFTDRSFGYDTACAAAVEAIRAAHAEARTVRNGVGLVKLMGRHSGFIACAAALAASEVDFVLIPEIWLVWSAKMASYKRCDPGSSERGTR